jgi:uncharacterized membrane protein
MTPDTKTPISGRNTNKNNATTPPIADNTNSITNAIAKGFSIFRPLIMTCIDNFLFSNSAHQDLLLSR